MIFFLFLALAIIVGLVVLFVAAKILFAVLGTLIALLIQLLLLAALVLVVLRLWNGWRRGKSAYSPPVESYRR